MCGGTLIQKSVILTAAHCFHDSNHVSWIDDKLYRIHLGGFKNDGKTGEQQFSIKKKILHHGYNKDDRDRNTMFDNDIALVKLSRNAVISATVSPVCLPHPKTEFYGELAYVAGCKLSLMFIILKFISFRLGGYWR